LTPGPGWWAIPPSSPSPPPSQLKGGGTSGSGRHSRATRPACPSGRPFGRMTGTLHRTSGGGATSTPAGGRPAHRRPRSHTQTASRRTRCRHTRLPVPSTPADTPPIRRGTHSLHGTARGRAARAPSGTPHGLHGRPRSPCHHVWGAVANSGHSFVERACAWRVLHGCVFTGAFKRYVSMPVSPADRFCTHSTCGAPNYDTLSHVFLTSHLASQVWSWPPALAPGRMPRPSGFGSASFAWRRFGRRTAAATTATARPLSL
jgi:hypothetical protein